MKETGRWLKLCKIGDHMFEIRNSKKCATFSCEYYAAVGKYCFSCNGRLSGLSSLRGLKRRRNER